MSNRAALFRRGGPAATPARACRSLWLVVWIVVLDVIVGGGWDAERHRTEPFDGFFSPPHLFIYGVALIAMALTVRLLARPDLRRWFGPPVRLPAAVRDRLPWIEVPASLALFAGGMAGIAVAGPIDAVWHTAFGLDETSWSVPHSMVGTSMLVLALGAVAGRLALAPHVPPRRWTVPALALLVLFASLTLLGPLGNASPEVVRAMSGQGALATDPDAQHTFRIYLRWNLTRTNPLFLVVGAAWAGYALALLCRLLPRVVVWLPIVVIFAVLLDGGAAQEAEHLGVGQDTVTRIGLPLLCAAVPLFLSRRRGYPWPAFAAAGGLFAAAAYALSVAGSAPVAGLLAVLVAPVAAVAGGYAGRATRDAVQAPTGRRAALVLAALLIAWPLGTGAIDLVLRTVTP